MMEIKHRNQKLKVEINLKGEIKKCKVFGYKELLILFNDTLFHSL